MSILGKTALIAGGLVTVGALTDANGDVDTSPIPDRYLALYQQAANTCPNLDWALLAGVGEEESDHGRSPLPGVHSGTNDAGAAGPMQFLAATFRAVRTAHPEVGPNVYDPAHAIPAAAHYLCDSGVAAGDINQGLYTYNNSWAYVRTVKAQADAYRNR